MTARPIRLLSIPTAAVSLLLAASLSAQMRPMPGMDMNNPSPMDDSPMMRMMDQMHPATFLQEIQHHATSGTSAEPDSTPAPMAMSMRGSWMLMLHGVAFAADTQQSGPRGADKLFSTNWLMPMAERGAGPGQLTLRAMFSLEPATVSGRQYPLLFQQGETAFGKAIADALHPHNFFMEIAALYDLRLGPHTLLSFYAAPVGDPALGPTAYPHRASAAENPVGTLGHHQMDSTHIADDVVTLGVAQGIVRVEASGFHGREPNESRWSIQQGAIDSWSMRLTVQPRKNWSGQYSYGRIASPEALFPTENQTRMTASAMYNRPIGPAGNWTSTSTLAWGRTRDSDGGIENSYLLESTLRFATKNAVWTRIENAGRSNELVLGERLPPPNFAEAPLTHVQAYTFGYDRDLLKTSHTAFALGTQMTIYGVGAPLQPIYGQHPFGAVMFLRLRAI